MRETINSRRYSVPVQGFTQAVRVRGDASLIVVSGVTARQADGTVSPDGIEGQTRLVFQNLAGILAEAGATLDDVVRIVTYLVDMNDHAAMHAVRREFFGDAPPASTTVEVSRLFDQRQLIEVEATAALAD